MIRYRISTVLVLLFFLLIITLQGGYAVEEPPEIKMPDEKTTLGTYMPDVRFFDSKGNEFYLKEVLGDRPLVVSFIYTRCVTACLIITGSLKDAVSEIGGLGEDYRVLTFSFDPRDMPHDLERFRRQWDMDGKDWIVASAEGENMEKFLKALDFHYTFNRITGEIFHPNFLVILSPDGKITRYLYGVFPEAKNLKLSILEAKKGKTSFSPLEGFLLRCYTYDPATNSYRLDLSFIIGVVMGGGTIITIFLVVWGKSIYSFLFRRKGA